MRVSTGDQHPETQLYDLREAAKQRQFNVVAQYTDRISGAKARRPGLDDMLRDARRRKFDVLMVVAFDRLARSTRRFLEVLDELSDIEIEPPHCGLLFAGTHELEKIFTRQALELVQWRSRFHAGQAWPGISEQEAVDIVHSEVGSELSQRGIQKLISKSRIIDLRNGGQHSYVSARRLFWVIRELQAVANSR